MLGVVPTAGWRFFSSSYHFLRAGFDRRVFCRPFMGEEKRAFILENVCWFHYKSRRLQEREMIAPQTVILR